MLRICNGTPDPRHEGRAMICANVNGGNDIFKKLPYQSDGMIKSRRKGDLSVHF